MTPCDTRSNESTFDITTESDADQPYPAILTPPHKIDKEATMQNPANIPFRGLDNDLDLTAAIAHSAALRAAMHLMCESIGVPQDAMFTSTEDDSTELGRYVRKAIDHISRERGIPLATMTKIGKMIDSMVAYELGHSRPAT